jgi:hypothetical protein
MKGGAPRVVWMTLGLDPRVISAYSAAQRFIQLGRPPHLVWNPVTGETVQILPIVRAGCALIPAAQLDHERPLDGDQAALVVEPSEDMADVHTQGRLSVQLGVVAFGWEPFTSGPMSGIGPIMDWLDSWSISRRWPAGRPAPFAKAHTVSRSRRLWSCGGHFGASQVPGCAAAGPGAIDVELLTGSPVKRAGDVPLPRGAAQLGQHPVPVSRMGNVLPGDDQAALAKAG